MLGQSKEKISRLLKLDFIRFCVVGGIGFLINLVLLNVFHIVFKLPIVVAQLIAAEVALFSNFMLHHHWTYKDSRVDKPFKKLILQFHATAWPAIVGSSAMVVVGVNVFHLLTIEALVMSSAVALLWNFFWSKYVIWKDTTKEDIERIIS